MCPFMEDEIESGLAGKQKKDSGLSEYSADLVAGKQPVYFGVADGKLFIDYLKPLKRQMITRKMVKLKREKARA